MFKGKIFIKILGKKVKETTSLSTPGKNTHNEKKSESKDVK